MERMMDDFPISLHTPNITTYWHGSDDESTFDAHWKESKKRRQLIDFGYEDPKSITYIIDHNGFRNPIDLIAPPYILALGCSFTFGTGLRFEETWPYLLSKKMNIAVYNAGMAGTSTDCIYRIARTFIPENKPTHVFHFITDIDRREIISDFVNDGQPCNLTGDDWYKTEYGTNIDSYCKIEISDYSSMLNREKNCLAIKQLCHDNNASYYDTAIEDSQDCHPPETNFARDLAHPGKKFQAAVADKMYNLYLKNEK